MKNKLGIFFLFWVAWFASASAQEQNLDPNLQNLRLNGFFRTRGWYMDTETKMRDFTSDGEKTVSYSDLFFRNRLELKVLPGLFINYTFDIFNVFGEEAAALGNNDVTMKTRSVFFVINFGEKSQLSAGLQPFSVSGGYILARDGAGIKYEHKFLNGKLTPYFYWIKAYDNSREENLEGYGKNNYSDDDIYTMGTKINYLPNLNGEFYLIYERDMDKSLAYNPDAPGSRKTGNLCWVGSQSQWITGNWNLQWGGIYNWGILSTNDERRNPRRVVSAAQYEASIGYQFRHTLLSFVSEGATGDASDEFGKDSFQQIKASHGFSNIFINDSGGIAFRASGESPWYGLYGFGLKADFILSFALKGELRLETRLLHFQSTHSFNGSHVMGEEWDFRAEYVFYKKLAMYLESGLFFPMRAYHGLSGSPDKSATAEIMLGTTIRY